MKIDFDFQYKDPIRPEILEILASGFDEVFHDYDKEKKLPPRSVRFCRQGDCIVEIIDQMYDLRDQLEIGILQFRRAEHPAASLHRELVDRSFGRSLSISKMLIKEGGNFFASGIRIEADTGLQIIVTAGSLPYSIAVNIPGIVGDSLFSPEYYLDRYIDVPLSFA